MSRHFLSLFAIAVGAVLAVGCAGNKTIIVVATPTLAPLPPRESTAASPQIGAANNGEDDNRATIARKTVENINNAHSLSLQIEGNLLLLQLVLGGVGTSAQVAEAGQQLLEACTKLDLAPMSNYDLWPTPYKDLAQAAKTTCLPIGQYRSKGNLTDQAWETAVRTALLLLPKLKAAREVLPDLSQAQLLRAVQERQ